MGSVIRGAALVLCLAGVTSRVQPPVSVLRISAGPHGSEVNGTFRLDEERARFDPTKDKEVVVLFQWEGAAGAHRLGVQWRSPDGAHSTNSAIDYIAKDRRFGAYWTLPLTGAMQSGTWSVEASVDGQPAGRFTFELAPGAVRADAVARRPLSTADMYGRLASLFVVLDRLGSRGQHLDPASALPTAGQRLMTSFAALDGADQIEAVFPDGTRRRIEALQSFNRKQDWAVLIGGPAAVPDAPIAAGGATKVGDRCFSMDASVAGSRVLVEGAVGGQLNASGTGGRLIVQWINGPGIPGAPVLNEFGEVIGIVAGSLVPGASTTGELLKFRAELRGVPVVPVMLIRNQLDAPMTSLADLRTRGDVLPALQGAENVVSAGFAKQLQRGTSIVSFSDQRDEFASSEKTLVAFINWNAQTRLKGMLVLRLVDESNHTVAESKPSKFDLRPGPPVVSKWELPIPSQPGWYRVDYLLDGKPMYRAFVKVTG